MNLMASPSPCSHHEGAAMKEISRGLELISRLQAQLIPLIPLIQTDGEMELASYLCQEAMKSLSLSLSILQTGAAAQVTSEKIKSIHEDDGGHVKLIRGQKRRRHKDLNVIVTSEPYFDGYQWRKYGQKTIKKSLFQRTYYMCINWGCKATKTVQQMDCDEPPNFLVGYDMQHSCKVAQTNQNLRMDSTSTRVVPPIIEANSLITNENLRMDSTSTRVVPPIIEANSLMKIMINNLEEESSPNSLFLSNMHQETSSPNSHFQNNMNQETSSLNSHFQSNMNQDTSSPNTHFHNNMNQATSSPNSQFQSNMNQETSSPNSHIQNIMNQETSSLNSHFQNNMNQDNCKNLCEECIMTQEEVADTIDHFSGIFMPQMFSPICPMYSDEEIKSAWLMETFGSHEVDSIIENHFSFDLS